MPFLGLHFCLLRTFESGFGGKISYETIGLSKDGANIINYILATSQIFCLNRYFVFYHNFTFVVKFSFMPVGMVSYVCYTCRLANSKLRSYGFVVCPSFVSSGTGVSVLRIWHGCIALYFSVQMDVFQCCPTRIYRFLCCWLFG